MCPACPPATQRKTRYTTLPRLLFGSNDAAILGRPRLFRLCFDLSSRTNDRRGSPRALESLLHQYLMMTIAGAQRRQTESHTESHRPSVLRLGSESISKPILRISACFPNNISPKAPLLFQFHRAHRAHTRQLFSSSISVFDSIHVCNPTTTTATFFTRFSPRHF